MKKVVPQPKKAAWVPQERQFCNYVHRVCMQTRLDGYNYCIRHILEDKTAPFRQCTFVHMQSGQRCSNAAPRSEKRDSFLCPWHSKIAQRTRCLNYKHPSVSSAQNPQILMEVLERHCPQPHPESDPQAAADNPAPTRLLDAYESCSESESDNEMPLHNFTWKKEADTDAESSDSQQEDPLKHAGVYSAEETALILRDKLIRLQSLYLGQFKRLEHVWKEKHNKYLQALKMEDGTETKSTSSKAQQYKYQQRLKALRHYHRPYGAEAVLQWKLRLKKMRSYIQAGNKTREHLPEPPTICTFSESNTTSCGSKAIPYSNYCYKHILNDGHQVLYLACQPNCLRPVAPLSTACILHTTDVGDLQRVAKLAEEHWTVEVTRQADLSQEPELFQTMDDIAALGLDVVQPGSLFGLNQFGEFGDTSGLDSSLVADLNASILCDNGKTAAESSELS